MLDSILFYIDYFKIKILYENNLEEKKYFWVFYSDLTKLDLVQMKYYAGINREIIFDQIFGKINYT